MKRRRNLRWLPPPWFEWKTSAVAIMIVVAVGVVSYWHPSGKSGVWAVNLNIMSNITGLRIAIDVTAPILQAQQPTNPHCGRHHSSVPCQEQ